MLWAQLLQVLYIFLSFFFNTQKGKAEQTERDRDRQHCFRQIDVAKGQQTKAHSLTHTHLISIVITFTELDPLLNRTKPNKSCSFVIVLGYYSNEAYEFVHFKVFFQVYYM